MLFFINTKKDFNFKKGRGVGERAKPDRLNLGSPKIELFFCLFTKDINANTIRIFINK
jgi:hypothetical protein